MVAPSATLDALSAPSYRRSRYRTLPGITRDNYNYIYLKVEWLLTEEIEWEMRWKVSDTTLIDGDTFPKTFYLQPQLWNWQRISGRIRYTQSRSGLDSASKNSIYVRGEYEW